MKIWVDCLVCFLQTLAVDEARNQLFCSCVVPCDSDVLPETGVD